MEENNNINKLSPSAVQKLKMDPPENAWNRLDAELARKQALMNERKANRFKLLFILTGLLLLCSVTYFYFAPGRVSTISSMANKAANPIVANKTTSPTLTEDKKEAIDKPRPISSTPVKEIAGNAAPSNTKNIVTSNNSTLRNKAVSNSPVSVTKVEKHPATTVSKKTGSKTNSPENAGNGSNKTQEGKIATQNTMPANENINSKAQPAAAPVIETTSPEVASPIEEKPVAAQQENEKKDLNQGNIEVVNPIASSSSMKPDSIKPSESTVVAEGKAPENNPVNPLAADKPKNILSRFSVAGFYSPDYTRYYLKANGATNFPPSLYYSHEKPGYSFAAGLAVRYDLTRHFSISSGCTYSTIAYTINLPAIYANYNSNNELHYMYPTSCGIIEMPNSDQLIALYKGESSTAGASCKQLLRFIKIPLMVRYQIGKNKFTGYVNAGVEANFMIQERANVSMDNTETTVINNIRGLQKMNYGFVGGIGVQYNLNKNTGIFIEPVVRATFNSLTQNTPVYCYPYSFLGGNIGLSFHF